MLQILNSTVNGVSRNLRALIEEFQKVPRPTLLPPSLGPLISICLSPGFPHVCTSVTEAPTCVSPGHLMSVLLSSGSSYVRISLPKAPLYLCLSPISVCLSQGPPHVCLQALFGLSTGPIFSTAPSPRHLNPLLITSPQSSQHPHHISTASPAPPIIPTQHHYHVFTTQILYLD